MGNEVKFVTMPIRPNVTSFAHSHRLRDPATRLAIVVTSTANSPREERHYELDWWIENTKLVGV